MASETGPKLGLKTIRFLILCFFAAIIGLILLWRFSPLGDLLGIDSLVAWSRNYNQGLTFCCIFTGLFLVAGLIMFPITILTMTAPLVLGLKAGIICAYIGSFLSAMLTFSLVRYWGRDPVRAVSSRKVTRLSKILGRNGILATIIMRNIPGSFGLVSVVSAVSHISFRDYFLGNLLGIIPSTIAECLFAVGVFKMFQHQKWELGILILAFALMLFLLWKRVYKYYKKSNVS